MLQLTEGAAGPPASGAPRAPSPSCDLKLPRSGPQRSLHRTLCPWAGGVRPCSGLQERGGREAAAPRAISEHDSSLGLSFPFYGVGPWVPVAVTFCVCTVWGGGLRHLCLSHQCPHARGPSVRGSLSAHGVTAACRGPGRPAWRCPTAGPGKHPPTLGLAGWPFLAGVTVAQQSPWDPCLGPCQPPKPAPDACVPQPGAPL